MENKNDWWVEDWESLWKKFEEENCYGYDSKFIKDFITKTLEENNRRINEGVVIGDIRCFDGTNWVHLPKGTIVVSEGQLISLIKNYGKQN